MGCLPFPHTFFPSLSIFGSKLEEPLCYFSRRLISCAKGNNLVSYRFFPPSPFTCIHGSELDNILFCGIFFSRCIFGTKVNSLQPLHFLILSTCGPTRDYLFFFLFFLHSGLSFFLFLFYFISGNKVDCPFSFSYYIFWQQSELSFFVFLLFYLW